MLSFSPVVGIGTPPPPHLQANVFPPPLVPGEGGIHTRLQDRGWGANSDEGTDSMLNMYLVGGGGGGKKDKLYVCGRLVSYLCKSKKQIL